MYFFKLLKLTSMSAIVVAMGVGMSVSAQALTIRKSETPVAHVFGSELSVVRFQQGEFRNRGNGQWDEISSKTNQVTFRFVAQAVTTNHVTLFDASRNVTLVLDLNLGQILFAVGTPTFRPLYNITTFEFSRRLPAGQPSIVGSGVTPPPVDERKWQHFASRSQGRRVHRLDYGIPETDDITFRASCVRGSGAARFLISTNVGRQPNGSNARIRFNANGFGRQYSGRVIGVGNWVSLGASDPLWSALARKNSISYSAFGKRSQMGLSGSSRAVNAFLTGCRPRPVVQQPRSPNPPVTNSAGGEISCNRFGRIASRNSNRRTNVTFLNRSGGQRTVMWIDYQGRPKRYGDIPAGASRTFSTFMSHPWMIVNGPGDCSQLFLPRPRGATFVVKR